MPNGPRLEMPDPTPATPDEHLTSRLAALLADRFGLTTSQTEQMVEDVRWRVFRRGDLTFSSRDHGEGREWLILSGRMQRRDGATEIGAGAFLQEGRAVRPLLVAGLAESAVDDVSVRAPELAVARALAALPAAEPACATVTAVVVGPGLDPRYEVSRLRDGLATLGPTIALWPRRVDLRLGVVGAPQWSRRSAVR